MNMIIRPKSKTRLLDVQSAKYATIKKRAPAITSATPIHLLIFRGDQFVTLTMNIDNLNLRIVLQVLTQLGDVDIHGAGIEIVVVDPEGLQGEVALQDLVGVAAKQGQQFVLLGSQFTLFVAQAKQLFLGVEGELSDAVNGALLVLLTLRATDNSLNTEHELFH